MGQRQKPPSPAARPARIVASLADVAAFFGVRESTVKAWRGRGMPGEPGGPGRPGRYDLAEVSVWRVDALGGSGRPDDEPADLSRGEAERRKAWADAQRAVYGTGSKPMFSAAATAR